MEKLTMILHDGTEIGIAEFSIPMHVIVLCKTRGDALSIWTSLTEGDHLSIMQIAHNGDVILEYRNVLLTGVQYIMNNDGTVSAHFYMDGERQRFPDEEYAHAARILFGEEEI